MEPISAPSDPISDNTPKAVLENGPQRLVYILITAMGFLFIIYAAYIRYQEGESWVSELSIALGVAISAPGILSYMYRRYLLEDIKAEFERPAEEFKNQALDKIEEATKEVVSHYEAAITKYEEKLDLMKAMENAGLFCVYNNRRYATKCFVPFIEEENEDIMVVGSSLKGLILDTNPEYEEIREALKERIKRGIRVRFLLTHPKVADLRAKQENRRLTDIGQEIIDSLCILLDNWKIDKQNIKLYLGTPTCFGIRTGKAMMLNFYPYMKEAYASPCLIVLKEKFFYDAFDASHFQAWMSDMAEPISGNMMQLQDNLNEFAEDIKKIIHVKE